jgi:peptidyl-prolyl cis-trans isomerase C
MMKYRLHLLVVALFLFTISACQTTPQVVEQPAILLPSPTTPAPTATSAPLAAIVNGEPVHLESYQGELARFESASGTDLATVESAESTVIRAMIEIKLLAQAARALDLELEDAELDQRITELAADLGDENALNNWMAEYGYSTDEFRAALRDDIEAGKMMEQLRDGVSKTELHVLARHILVADRNLADQLLSQIQEGADFAQLALDYSQDLTTRLDGGNLGWFPKGTLTQIELEEDAFKLLEDEISEVVESSLGFHILQVQGRENRELLPDTLAQRQKEAVQSWLDKRWEASSIEILISP